MNDRLTAGNYTIRRHPNTLTDPVPATGSAPDQTLKKDLGKVPYHLLPYDALEEVARVLQFGANKYAERGWEAGISYSRVFGAILRHTFAWWRGEDNDPETGRHHLAHATAECLFVLAYALRKRTDLDDRNKNEAPL